MEGLESHCDVIQEPHSYRMISEALGTQLAEITDRVLSHWLPTSQSEAAELAERGREREQSGEPREGGACGPGRRAALAPPTPDSLREPEQDADSLGAAAMEELFET